LESFVSYEKFLCSLSPPKNISISHEQLSQLEMNVSLLKENLEKLSLEADSNDSNTVDHLISRFQSLHHETSKNMKEIKILQVTLQMKALLFSLKKQKTSEE